ncbi:MAG: electron transfer flavoprotein subunit alpha/FixB family protein [Firmicutes bacterium]|nr:electron transfer flavoprotein subunit alpha/FixB family protein [Bacillota bacterium]MCL5057259.1 electron transfer flavoprotein subunit alpha/FixB family protein [Actinomycetota bacterium]
MEIKGNIMVLAEVRSGNVHSVTYEMIAWGRRLAEKTDVLVDCLVLGTGEGDFEELIRGGADRVLVVSPGMPDSRLATPAASLLVSAIRGERPDIVIAPATTYGRTIMPIAAARLGTGLTADCTDLDIDPKDSLLMQTRPAIGGNIMATIKTPRTRPQMATVRPRSIKPLPADTGRRGEVVRKDYSLEGEWQERFISFIRSEEGDANLESAEIVLTGGKGIKSRDNFKQLAELAGLMGAGLGATRDAVEAGWAPFSCQVGLTGKTVAPKVYIAAGVSGKIQHLAGMITSDYIVAINEDPKAQIFKVADLGIIGDAPMAVQELTRAFKSHSEKGEGA